MQNVIIKKEVIEIEKEKFISGIPFEEQKKNYIRQGVSTDDIFSFFLNIKSPDQLKELNLDSASLHTMEDYIPFTTNYIKVKILTAMIQAAIQLHFISKEMSFDDRINLLIDLKNDGDIETLQILLSDTLENDLGPSL